MNMNKVIVAQHPDGRIHSISILDFRHANISTITPVECGEIYTSNCMRKPGEINNQLIITVERKVARIIQRITNNTSNRSLDAVFL